MYYYGNGIFVAYTLRCFTVNNCKRIEYGDEGVYAVSLYHFIDKDMLKEYFNLSSFEHEDFKEIIYDEINDEVRYGKTYAQIKELDLGKKYVGHYREGVSRVLVNGKFQIRNLFITCGKYTLFFRGDSKKCKLSGYQYTLCE